MRISPLFRINMPVIRVTDSVKSELEKMKKEEDYQSFNMVIRELIHERGDRRMPESSELSEKARGEIKDLAEKYSGLLGDVECLPEPVKSLVWFGLLGGWRKGEEIDEKTNSNSNHNSFGSDSQYSYCKRVMRRC